jgi:hypothetical protein
MKTSRTMNAELAEFAEKESRQCCLTSAFFAASAFFFKRAEKRI